MKGSVRAKYGKRHAKLAGRLQRVIRWLLELTGRQPMSIERHTTTIYPPRPTIFIECTNTYHSDHHTGIQRVARNILRYAPTIARESGYDVVPVVVEADQFRFVPLDRVIRNKHVDHDKTITTPALASPALPRRLWRVCLRVLAAVIPFSAVRALLYAPPHRPGLANVMARLLPLRSQPTPKPVELLGCLDDYERYDGSILLLLDTSWHVPIWPGVRRFKERGGMVVGVIYDLIPITHSHTCAPETPAAFESWLLEHLRLTHGFVCISRSTATALREYIARRDSAITPQCPPIEHFHLGSELDFVNSSATVRPAIRDIFTSNSCSFLTVGTIEPRKMHAFLLDAFDRFWAEGGDAAFVIVGGRSWRMEAFLDRVARHPELDRRLFVLRDANDVELDFAYRSASSLVIASETEGFGLPIVEAFQYDLPVMCSDIPAFREIAGSNASFFSLSDPRNLTVMLEAFCIHSPATERRNRIPQSWISWRQSTEQLFNKIMRLRQA